MSQLLATKRPKSASARLRRHPFVMAVFFVSLTFSGSGCHPLAKKNKKVDVETEGQSSQIRSPAAAVVTELPKRVDDPAVPAAGGSDVTSSSTSIDVEVKTGRLKSDLVLRLDYFPEAKPWHTTLPVCYDPFPDEFELGTIACAGQEAKPLFAKHVAQECYTKAAAAKGMPARIAVKEPLSFVGCAKVLAKLHSFAPALRLDAETSR